LEDSRRIPITNATAVTAPTGPNTFFEETIEQKKGREGEARGRKRAFEISRQIKDTAGLKDLPTSPEPAAKSAQHQVAVDESINRTPERVGSKCIIC
jgi:hypothetical protein